MRAKKLLLASTALSAALGCGGKKQQHQLHGNPKGTHYDQTLADAGVPDGAPGDAVVEIGPGDEIGPPGNPKGALYDDGLAKPPAR